MIIEIYGVLAIFTFLLRAEGNFSLPARKFRELRRILDKEVLFVFNVKLAAAELLLKEKQLINYFHQRARVRHNCLLLCIHKILTLYLLHF